MRSSSKSCPEAIVPRTWTNSSGRTRCSWNSDVGCRWSCTRSGRVAAARSIGNKSHSCNPSSGYTSWSRDGRSTNRDLGIRTAFTSSSRSFDRCNTSHHRRTATYLLRIGRMRRIGTISNTTGKVSCPVIWSSVSPLASTFSFISLALGYVEGPIAAFAGFSDWSIAWAENLIKGEIVSNGVLGAQTKKEVRARVRSQ